MVVNVLDEFYWINIMEESPMDLTHAYNEQY